MRSRHLIKRGKRFSFVCRVPTDLSNQFPTRTIWKTLKADNEKDAHILAAAEEYQTQQLFLKLRTGMLSKDLEKRLVALYLKKGIDSLENLATGQSTGKDKYIDEAFQSLGQKLGLSPKEAREKRAVFNSLMADRLKELIGEQEIHMVEDGVNALAERLKDTHGVKMTSADKKSLSLKFLNNDKLLHEAESAVLRGEWALLEALKEKAEKELALPYIDLRTALEKYESHYLSSNPDVAAGTKDDMKVECRVLLEICGNISIGEFNSMATVTKVKGVLLKFPKNKQQRYGDKSIHTIIRNESGYEIISRKTANEYLKRAKAVVNYAGKEKWIQTLNVWDGELFRTDRAAEEQRLAYDNEDVRKLINAICTQPLWAYGDPKPERFWVILIALLHGFRLSNILELTKRDIFQTE